METLFTKNVSISILVGVLIVAGAFWTRLNDSADKTTISTQGSTDLAYQKDTSQTDTTKNPDTDKPQHTRDDSNTVIRVADLPNVNGISDSYIPAALLSSVIGTGDQANNVLTPSPSTMGYGEITDPSTIYDVLQKYKPSDLSSVVDTNRASIISYSSSLANILKDYPFYKKGGNPADITLKVFDSNDETDLNKITAMQDSYDQTIQSLLSVATPEGLKNFHLDLLNSLDRTSQLMGKMANLPSGKLLALNSARQYVEESRLTLTIFTAINNYLKKGNITFGKNDTVTLNVDFIK